MNLRKYVILPNLFFVICLSVGAEELTWLYGGVDSFQDCSAIGQVVRGLCGSGYNRDCKKDGTSSFSSAGCGDFPFSGGSPTRKLINIFDMKNSIMPGESMNSWQCVRHSVNYSCPAGYVVVGVCGSGKNEDCHQYCDPSTHSAIKCAPIEGGQGVNFGHWSIAQKWGSYFQCEENEVVCGACQSGKNEDCNGGHFRVKCCEVGDYEVVGRWNYMRTVVGDTTETLSRGTNKRSSETTSKSWSASVTSSVQSGLKILGIGVTASLSLSASTSYANNYSEEWSSNEQSGFSFYINGSEKGKALWQWVFDITDPYRNEVTSRTMDYALTEGRHAPPRCQPGFSADRSVDYQYCTSDDRILPGFQKLWPPTASPIASSPSLDDISPQNFENAVDSSSSADLRRQSFPIVLGVFVLAVI